MGATVGAGVGAAVGAGVGAAVGVAVGVGEQVSVHLSAVVVPWVSSVHRPVVRLQLNMGALHAAMHSLGGCVLSESISHWPVVVLQLYPVQSEAPTGSHV